MMEKQLKHQQGTSLRGRTVFLSGSIPTPERSKDYQRVEDAPFKIEEAVISLARSVFFEGGKLVFGGHPSISPLIAMVAGEYLSPREAEDNRSTNREREKEQKPVIIYQSRAFENILPNETWLLQRLGYAEIHWVETVDNETFDPTQRDGPPVPKSMKEMRTRMVIETKPVAMVCIGGMDGVEFELDIFREIQKYAPIYTLRSTGGAAALIAAQTKYPVRVIDDELLLELSEKRPANDDQEKSEGFSEKYVPFPIIMQRIVQELYG